MPKQTLVNHRPVSPVVGLTPPHVVGPQQASVTPVSGHKLRHLSVLAPQAKLTVNTPGDRFEQEADATADLVMRSQDVPSDSTETRALTPFVQRASGGAPSNAPDVSETVSRGLAGGGQALDSQTRALMEPRFGYDFSSVKIHTDARASQSAEHIAARAYTVGKDIVFRSGAYQPSSSTGQRLLAHELTHVIQQSGQVQREALTKVDDPSPTAGWAPIAKLIAEQLGNEDIKGYAKSAAGKGVDRMIAQIGGAAAEKDFASTSHVELMGTMLSEQAKQDAEVIAASDAAKSFRAHLLKFTREQPVMVIAAAIAAAAVAYLADADVPEISKKVKILEGLTGGGKLDLGKLQGIALKHASADLKYTSTNFSAGLMGAYAGEGDKQGASGGANIAFGDKDIQFKASVKREPDGKVKLDLGQAIDLKNFGMETGVTIQGDNMAAIVQVKVGDRDYISSKATVGQDGTVALDLGIKAYDWTFTGTATGLGGEKAAGEGSMTNTNIFGVKGLDATAKVKFGEGGVTSAGGSIRYGADTKDGRAYIRFNAETIGGGDKKDGPPIGVQGVIDLGFTFR